MSKAQQVTKGEGIRQASNSLSDGCIMNRNRVLQQEMTLKEVRKMISLGKRLGIQLLNNEEEVQSRLMAIDERVGDVGRDDKGS
ncbi:hypothetical protein SLA2020_328130 [Shorea laevis]